MTELHPRHPASAAASTGALTRRALLERGSLAAAGLLSLDAYLSVPARAHTWPPASAYGSEVPTAWYDLMLDLVQGTPGYSPPVAARAFAYSGVALYEAVVPGIPDRHSLAGRLNGFRFAPAPRFRAHHWPTVASTALAAILRELFPTAPPELLAAIDELERDFLDEARRSVPTHILRHSVERGRSIADLVFEWSKGDGGHEGYKDNFPPYDPPTGPGFWVPTPPDFLPALQPYWGDNRPCLLRDGRVGSAGPPIRYSEERGSRFYREAYEVYTTVNNLSPEQREIALFWADPPGQTPTPAGHSISILTQIVRLLGTTLDRTVEAYAKVGIGVGDGFVSCWNTKYRFNLLRPVTYIQDLIDPSWLPLLVTPSFPEYTSGHSVQSGTAAHVMTDLFGEVAFTDHTHDDRGLPPRSFSSFTDAAREAGMSRLYGGIHFRAAIERGLEQGIRVGRRVNVL